MFQLKTSFFKLFEHTNLNSGFILLSLRFSSLSSQPPCLEKDRLTLSIGKNTENLKEFSLETKQNKPKSSGYLLILG
ncbi:unknown protein [Simkania negevensis Z]|uniref:Uncharacterized protein n=1 Tax=Simkania negevensis (strain ATCC VR-1471 / DSM 27360 / Z) TaxID=331113 RepID=F8L4D8_SIMNZ|nr:unknown protein [Simkania negevensis Z]